MLAFCLSPVVLLVFIAAVNSLGRDPTVEWWGIECDSTADLSFISVDAVEGPYDRRPSEMLDRAVDAHGSWEATDYRVDEASATTMSWIVSEDDRVVAMVSGSRLPGQGWHLQRVAECKR